MSSTIISPWRIESHDLTDRAYLESIFSLGNGYMGTRGYRPDQRGEHPAWRSTFLAGFYEYIRPGITDLVNQPDFSSIHFSLNGKDSEAHQMSQFIQMFDMKQGIVSWEYTLTDDQGNQTLVRQEKFLSMADKHIAGMRLSLTPVNWSGLVELSSGIDASVENLPISDDQLTENTEFVQMWGEISSEELPAGGILTAMTKKSHRQCVLGYLLFDGALRKTTSSNWEITTKLCGELEQGKNWACEKLVAVASYRDGDAKEIVQQSLDRLSRSSFAEQFNRSAQAWGTIWEDVDVQIVGNDEWQGAIRYNIMQLIQAMPYGDPHSSIGARGLTHGRYKGCYFWDTEVFMFPLFAYTQPDAAKSLLKYRYNTLHDALESAKGFSAKGARYSWMSSDTGYEQCETWDTGCCEIHITADVAYAIEQYRKLTGDNAFMQDCGVEILLQTARYWVDRFNYSPEEDVYHLLFVKGPDEYCGVTVDDFYTVSLARDNLSQAVSAVEWMQTDYPNKWKALANKVGFQISEVKEWEKIASNVVLKCDENHVWRQDATFDLLEPLDIQAYKDDCTPLYHKIGFDRLQRYQVLKQPAVLMYMSMCPDRFSEAEIEAAWNYYEPKTLHDSTLSFGIHALIAARLGKVDKAVEYFEKSLFLDLRDIMGNTAREGIHTGSLGSTWQAMVLGFGGLGVKDGAITVDGLIPEGIEGINYRAYFQGKKHQIKLSKDCNGKILRVIESLQ